MTTLCYHSAKTMEKFGREVNKKQNYHLKIMGKCAIISVDKVFQSAQDCYAQIDIPEGLATSSAARPGKFRTAI